MAAGRQNGPGVDCFHVAQGENVAMTVETKTDPSRKETSNWTPRARRHGERPEWAKRPQALPEADDDVIFPSISPPLIWPRVFPGL
jgi:hypothetical protein